MKLAIGTAQFGLNYSAFNQSGQIPADHVKDILALAKSENVFMLYTATAYGDVERVLGQLKTDHVYSYLLHRGEELRGRAVIKFGMPYVN